MIMENERDIAVLRKILRYCCEVDEAVERFGKNFEIFENDAVFRNAVSMPIMQIGELTKQLSDEFTATDSNVPWHSIRGMRNWFAHNYHGMDIEAIWGTVVNDIPVLRKFCEDTLSK